MNVTQNVITDLWPVYASGDASADTVALVEQFLHSDPAFGELIRESDAAQLLPRVDPAMSPNLEKRALVRTKRRLRIRSTTLGLAIALCVLPLSSHGSSEHGLEWLMLRDAPGTSGVALLLSAGFWVSYFLQSRRL